MLPAFATPYNTPIQPQSTFAHTPSPDHSTQLVIPPLGATPTGINGPLHSTHSSPTTRYQYSLSRSHHQQHQHSVVNRHLLHHLRTSVHLFSYARLFSLVSFICLTATQTTIRHQHTCSHTATSNNIITHSFSYYRKINDKRSACSSQRRQ